MKPLYRAGLVEIVEGHGYYGSKTYRLVDEADEILAAIADKRALAVSCRPRRRLSALT